MALVSCKECDREISDKAVACPGCGAPVSVAPDAAAPERVKFDGQNFEGTKALLAALAVKAIQSLRYKVDSIDEAGGLVAFTTRMTMGSWSGVSGSIYFSEVSPFLYSASGTAKQNLRGGQVIALDLFGESKNKINKVVEQMKQMAR